MTNLKVIFPDDFPRKDMLGLHFDNCTFWDSKYSANHYHFHDTIQIVDKATGKTRTIKDKFGKV